MLQIVTECYVDAKQGLKHLKIQAHMQIKSQNAANRLKPISLNALIVVEGCVDQLVQGILQFSALNFHLVDRVHRPPSSVKQSPKKRRFALLKQD